MGEEIVDIPVTVEKHVLEENPTPDSDSPFHEHAADIVSISSRRESTGKADSVRSVPNYLRASTGSCHDLCKFGKKQTFEEKPWKQKPRRKATSSSSVDFVLIKVADEQKKEKVGSTSLDAKTLYATRNASLGDKTRPLKYNPPSTKKAPSVETPEVIKKVISSSSGKKEAQDKRASLAGGKTSKTGEKADRDSDKYPLWGRASLAGDKVSKNEKADPQSDKRPLPRRASLAGYKLSKTEEKPVLQSDKGPLRRASKTEEKVDQQSDKCSLRRKVSLGGNKVPKTKEKADQQSGKPSVRSNTKRAKQPPPSDKSDGTCGKGDGKSSMKPDRKIFIARTAKKAWVPITAAVSTPKLRLVRTVSFDGKKTGTLKRLAYITKDRTTRTSKTEKILQKTLHIVKTATGSAPKSSPNDRDSRGKDNYRRTPRNKVAPSDDKHRSAVKLLFRSGKVVELLTPDSNNTPRRLKFRRRAPAAESSNSESTKQPFNHTAGVSTDVSGTEIPTKKVVLRRQVVQGNKEVRVLFNNVIEETASKLVVSRKSKVKALVGAFETVISLQEAKKKPSAPQTLKLEEVTSNDVTADCL